MQPFTIRLMTKKKDVCIVQGIFQNPKSTGTILEYIQHPTWMYNMSDDECQREMFLHEFIIQFRSKSSAMRFLSEHNDPASKSKKLLNTYGMRRGFVKWPTGYFYQPAT